jgi:tRNA-dihydrouridine synthase B
MKALQIGPLRIDPPILQAPMAGMTNYAYRQLIRRLGGVGLPATEMIGARSLRPCRLSLRESSDCRLSLRESSDCRLSLRESSARLAKREATAEARRRLPSSLPQELGPSPPPLPPRLWGIKEEPRPLAVQIWDNDPTTLAAVARYLVEEYAPSLIDLNFGCPTPAVAKKAQSGSYLLRDPERIGQIVSQVEAACRPVPVTAKIRTGCTRDTINAIDVVQAIEGAGGAAVTVHGRTAEDLFRGSADWDEIARIKPHLARIPLIGNGDLGTAAAVVEAFARYGVDGVMIGRAGLARPWLFRQAAAALRGAPLPPEPTPWEQRELLLDHFRLVVDHFGADCGTVLMRRYACHYGHGRPGARVFRREVAGVATPEQFLAVVNRFFPSA